MSGRREDGAVVVGGALFVPLQVMGGEMEFHRAVIERRLNEPEDAALARISA